MKTLKIPFLLLIFLLTACKKEKLTKETQIGANTFSCKINGKVYKTKNELFSKGLTVILFNGNLPHTYDLGVEAVMYNGDNSDYTIDLDLFGIKSEGEYVINNTTSKARLFDRHGNNYNAIEGIITITKFDLTNNIISGRFEFFLINDKNNKNQLSTTEGRFDLRY